MYLILHNNHRHDYPPLISDCNSSFFHAKASPFLSLLLAFSLRQAALSSLASQTFTRSHLLREGLEVWLVGLGALSLSPLVDYI